MCVCVCVCVCVTCVCVCVCVCVRVCVAKSEKKSESLEEGGCSHQTQRTFTLHIEVEIPKAISGHNNAVIVGWQLTGDRTTRNAGALIVALDLPVPP